MAAANPRVYKVALCGQSDVGKTSIFRQIKGDGFRENTEEFGHLGECKIDVDVNGRNVQISLWDTAGIERYSRLTRAHYHGSQVVLLVYDCDDRDSMEALKGYYRDAEYNAVGAAMVLVRNKIDKEDQSVDLTEAMNILCSQNTKRAESACRFAFVRETSARTNEGIQELFQEVAEYLLRNFEPANNRNTNGNNHWPQHPDPQPGHDPQATPNVCC